MMTTEYSVLYIGADSADLRNGEIYRAHDLKDNEKMIGVKDHSGEWYAYPRSLFEKVEHVRK